MNRVSGTWTIKTCRKAMNLNIHENMLDLSFGGISAKRFLSCNYALPNICFAFSSTLASLEVAISASPKILEESYITPLICMTSILAPLRPRPLTMLSSSPTSGHRRAASIPWCVQSETQALTRTWNLGVKK